MDQQGPHGQGQPPVMGVVGGTGALPYGTPRPFPPPQMVASGSPVGGVQPMGQPAPFTNNPAQLAMQQQMAYQQMHQQQQAQQNHQLEIFWANQLQEIEQTSDFKNHSLPLARIKKIMKADEDVRMIAAEAPVIFAKACEMFILELTLRSWIHTEENKRRTLQKNDIAAAITRTDIFDFLVDIVPRDEMKDEVMAGMVRPPTGAVAAPPPEAAVPYFYMAPPAAAAGVPPGMMIGRPAMDPTMYMQHPHPYLPPQMWQQQPLPQQPPPPQGGHDEGEEM